MENKRCQNSKINENELNNKKDNLPTQEEILKLAELFKIFGDNTRIKIIYAIYKKTLCVHDIANIVKMSHSAVSHQLRNLKQARLVKSQKEGKEVYYTLDDEHIENIFNLSIDHIREGL